MDDRTYVIALDPLDPAVDPAAIKSFIKRRSEFKNWWHHIPYLFLVTAPMSADGIAEILKPVINGSTFLVMEVDPANSDGWLTERAWNWIRKRSPSGTGEVLSRVGES